MNNTTDVLNRKILVDDLKNLAVEYDIERAVVSMDGSDCSYADVLLWSDAIGAENIVCVITPNPHWEWQTAVSFVEAAGAKAIIIPTTLIIADIINQVCESGEQISDKAMLELSPLVSGVVTRIVHLNNHMCAGNGFIQDIVDIDQEEFYYRYASEVNPHGRNN